VAHGQRARLSIFGADYLAPDATCIRDYIGVSDLASAPILVLHGLKLKDKLIYNIGNGRSFSVQQVIETVRRTTGHSIPVKEAARRPGDPAVLVASAGKLKRELNGAPEYRGLESIIRSAREWRSPHPECYGKQHPHADNS
jgi:UDP-glucose 4-epimerase